MEDIELLKKLSESYGISGHEKNIRSIIKSEFLKYVDEKDISYDKLGSICAKYGNGGVKIAISGHMDEVGMIVTKITDEGFIKFQTIGGWWSQVLSSQLVKVITEDNKCYTGVIGSIPPHVLTADDLKKPVDIDSLYIDLGANSKEDVLKMGIKIGDMICPNTKVEVMANGDYLLGKAWDNRIGCAIILKVLSLLHKNNIKNNTYYAMATVQEELGCRGAKTMGNIDDIDIAIAVDVTIAKDVIGTDGTNKMGSGPCILLYDGGLIGSTALREYALEISKKYNIDVQVDYLKRGSTDAGSLTLLGKGALGMSLCLPSRYIHSHASIISYKDYENAAKLIYNIIKDITVGKFKKMAYE